MKRVWDILVGICMVLGALAMQLIVIGILVGGLCGAAAEYFRLNASEWWMWVVQAVAAVLCHWLAFREFRQRGPLRRSAGMDGPFILLFRGLYKIAYGRETYGEEETGQRGFEVLLKSEPSVEAVHDPHSFP